MGIRTLPGAGEEKSLSLIATELNLPTTNIALAELGYEAGFNDTSTEETMVSDFDDFTSSTTVKFENSITCVSHTDSEYIVQTEILHTDHSDNQTIEIDLKLTIDGGSDSNDHHIVKIYYSDNYINTTSTTWTLLYSASFDGYFYVTDIIKTVTISASNYNKITMLRYDVENTYTSSYVVAKTGTIMDDARVNTGSVTIDNNNSYILIRETACGGKIHYYGTAYVASDAFSNTSYIYSTNTSENPLYHNINVITTTEEVFNCKFINTFLSDSPTSTVYVKIGSSSWMTLPVDSDGDPTLITTNTNYNVESLYVILGSTKYVYYKFYNKSSNNVTIDATTVIYISTSASATSNDRYVIISLKKVNNTYCAKYNKIYYAHPRDKSTTQEWGSCAPADNNSVPTMYDNITELQRETVVSYYFDGDDILTPSLDSPIYFKVGSSAWTEVPVTSTWTDYLKTNSNYHFYISTLYTSTRTYFNIKTKKLNATNDIYVYISATPNLNLMNLRSKISVSDEYLIINYTLLSIEDESTGALERRTAATRINYPSYYNIQATGVGDTIFNMIFLESEPLSDELDSTIYLTMDDGTSWTTINVEEGITNVFHCGQYFDLHTIYIPNAQDGYAEPRTEYKLITTSTVPSGPGTFEIRISIMETLDAKWAGIDVQMRDQAPTVSAYFDSTITCEEFINQTQPWAELNMKIIRLNHYSSKDVKIDFHMFVTTTTVAGHTKVYIGIDWQNDGDTTWQSLETRGTYTREYTPLEFDHSITVTSANYDKDTKYRIQIWNEEPNGTQAELTTQLEIISVTMLPDTDGHVVDPNHVTFEYGNCSGGGGGTSGTSGTSGDGTPGDTPGDTPGGYSTTLIPI